MQAISIDTNKRSIQTIDIEMKPNTVYTFFNSILIDELTSLNAHTVYADANALEENKTPYFLADQLLLGNTLITGNSSQGDTDVHIPISDLQALISYEVSQFYLDTLRILSQTDINLYRLFSLTKETKKIEVNVEWTLATFNIADERTKEYFLNELKKSLESQTTQEVIEKMAQFALNVA